MTKQCEFQLTLKDGKARIEVKESTESSALYLLTNIITRRRKKFDKYRDGSMINHNFSVLRCPRSNVSKSPRCFELKFVKG